MRSRVFVLVSFLLVAAGCQTVEEPYYAVKFSSLPAALGGGVGEDIIPMGSREILFPWETLYKLNARTQSITWGDVGEGNQRETEDFVETRALDGNEVRLAVTIQYRIDPAAIPHIIQRVGHTDDRIRLLVAAISRSDIRTHLNILNTREFIKVSERSKAFDRVLEALNFRLNPEGIIVDSVIYNDHKFERTLRDGSIDRTYQEQIEQTQTLEQAVEQEEKRIKAVIQEKRQQFEQTQAKVNRAIEDAKGKKRAAEIEGDAYLQVQTNEAKRILAKGNAEVEGLQKQIAALAGEGGRALLRLRLFEELIKNNPKFVVVNSEGNSGGQVNLNQLDTNELINQAGVFKSLANEPVARSQATVGEKAE